ncbi:MAG: hypothetical protein R3325_15430, partial [Thermoanaerobaculia bacterium]|nr:hypothetical protein [Thermoanaerobaculia bacterium]
TEAAVILLADEEIHLFVNGEVVASRRYRVGDRAARLPVAALLRAGANRLVAELRSERGVGGLLLRLEGDGGTLAVTGPSWRIARRYEPGMMAPGGPLPRLEPARVWGRPPTGRWRLGRPELLPPLGQTPLDGGPRLARRVRIASADSWERLQGDTDWRSLPLGRRVTFDWGEPITASINLVFARTETGRGFFWASDRPAQRRHWPPSGYFRKAPGSRSWTSTEMHTFRYLTVWSDTDLVGVRAFRFEPAFSGLRQATAELPGGIASLAPPQTSRPALERMWTQLERAEAAAARRAESAESP